MKQEYGASLIEIVGVLAIAGLMSGAAIGMYNVIRNNQARKIASVEMQEIARDAKLLMEMRGDYTGISVDYLVEQGALANNHAPIGGDNWSVTATSDGQAFSINLTDLSQGECQYFATTPPQWAARVIVNGFETDISDNCFTTNTNQLSFVVE